jgi:hypothetical protein
MIPTELFNKMVEANKNGTLKVTVHTCNFKPVNFFGSYTMSQCGCGKYKQTKEVEMDTTSTEMPMFSKNYCDANDTFKDAPLYRKKVATQAVRIDGPFIVATSEGELSCKDGYLCKDARGYPYPVAKEEFELIYRLDSED